MDKNAQQFSENVMEAVKNHAGDINTKISLLEAKFELEQERNDELEKKFNRGDLGPGAPMPRDSKKINDALRFWAKTGDEKVFEGLIPRKIQQAMEVGSDPGGGFLVGAVLAEQIAATLADFVAMRSICRIEPLTEGDAFEEPWSDRAGIGTGWVGETGSRPETGTQDLKMHRTPLHEIYSNPKLTQKVIDLNSFNLESWVTMRIAESFADGENTAFVSGSGVLQPQGFLSYTNSTAVDASRTWGELQYVATGVSAGFGSPNPGDELHDLVYSLKVQYRRNARFVMNRLTAAEVRKMKDGDGNYLWQQNFSQGEPDRLLGFPVTLIDDMPAIASNSLSIAFGDFSRGYLIVDRPGLSILRDPYTTKGQVFLYSTKRVGGALADSNAIKLLRFAAS